MADYPCKHHKILREIEQIEICLRPALISLKTRTAHQNEIDNIVRMNINFIEKTKSFIDKISLEDIGEYNETVHLN